MLFTAAAPPPCASGIIYQRWGSVTFWCGKNISLKSYRAKNIRKKTLNPENSNLAKFSRVFRP
jgi:hypothetical protein